MIKIFVDSGSSIKLNEKEKYGVEIIPLNLTLGEKEYQDGVNLTMEEFYRFMIEDKGFPKTSLPNLVEIDENVQKCLANGDEVIILTISSQISSTHDTIKKMYEDNKHVKVIDSKMAVGGMRLIVDEINRNRDKTLDEIEKKVKKLIPRIRIMAIPETLNYLLRGGRLSKKEWLIGSMLKIKPIIGFKEGKVSVIAKKIGLKNGMQYIVESLNTLGCDKNYDIIASYTYDRKNLDQLIAMTSQEYLPQIRVYDNLDPAIACHWGPNAFGYIFVSEKE